VLWPIEKQQVVVACDHVLRAEIEIGADGEPAVGSQKLLVTVGDPVALSGAREEEQDGDQKEGPGRVAQTSISTVSPTPTQPGLATVA